ncbi:MAG: hypothetical protein ACPG7F_18680 [Aggregatilineales bacterium]
MTKANFREQLRAAGYHVTVDIKAKYLDGMLSTLPHSSELIHVFRQETLIRLFSNAQLRKGRAYTFSQLQQIALPGEHDRLFQAYITDLLKRRIFHRVYVLPCDLCGIENYVKPSSLTEDMRCDNCRAFLNIPLDLAFSYHLSTLFQTGLKNGLLTVILALVYLMKNNADNLQFESHLLIKKQKQSGDIDLIVKYADTLYMIECKDNLNTRQTTLAGLETQLALFKDVADALNATPVFATLYDGDWLPDVTKMLEKYDIALWSREMLIEE